MRPAAQSGMSRFGTSPGRHALLCRSKRGGWRRACSWLPRISRQSSMPGDRREAVPSPRVGVLRQRANIKLSPLQCGNTLFEAAKHGCKWRGLSQRFGYGLARDPRMNLSSKHDARIRLLEQLEQIVCHPDRSRPIALVHREAKSRLQEPGADGCQDQTIETCFAAASRKGLIRHDLSRKGRMGTTRLERHSTFEEISRCGSD